MISNIVFDIGNVLVDYDPPGYIERREVPAELQERIMKAVFKNPKWEEFDRNVMSYDEVVQCFVDADPELEPEIRRILENTNSLIRRRDFAIPWIQNLKKRGYKTYCLSNFNPRIWNDNIEALDFAGHLDGGVVSHQVRLIKPDPAIYKALLEKYDLEAEECVFLDDVADNVEAARAVGMQGIVFDDYKTARNNLEEMLIENGL